MAKARKGVKSKRTAKRKTARRPAKRKAARRKPAAKRRTARRPARKPAKKTAARRPVRRAKKAVRKKMSVRRVVSRMVRKARPRPARRPARRSSAPDSKKGKNILLQQLEKLLGTFSDDMITSLDLKDEKKSLLRKINELRREEIHLQDMVEDLEGTRDKQAMEIKRKEQEESELKERIAILKDEKAGMESDKITLNQQVDALRREKEELNASLDRTNDLLVRFRAHIEEFDEDLKSE